MRSDHPAIVEFWNWFLEHRFDFDVLVDSDAPFWDAALGHLKRIDQHLWFEMSEPDGKIREFIVTAEGRKDVFPLVGEMISYAPIIEGWKFFALIPARGFDFTTTYEGVSFNPRSMWFLPLESRSRPRDFGIRVGVPHYGRAIKRQVENAVLVILDTALGERSAAIDIQFVEFSSLPESPESDGYIELAELPRYIEWRKRKRFT